jgi:lysozyme
VSECAGILELAAEIATSPWADSFEGTPYHDPVGYPTVGYGHLLSREPWADLEQFGGTISEYKGVMLLQEDMGKSLASVFRLIEHPLEDNQYAALVDFAFNCGSGNLQASTLRRVINRGELDEAPKQFRRWVHARGVKLPGLVRRREAEVEMWLA